MFNLAEAINLSGVRVVALDAVGTLIHPVQPVAATYVEVAGQFGVRLDEATIAARFKNALKRFTVESSFDSPALATSEEVERSWWHGFIAEVLEIESQDATPIFDALWHYYARRQSWRLFEDALILIDRLNALKCPWIIASNFDARLVDICRADPHLSTAQSVYPSSLVGWRKPSIQFFRKIESDLATAPNSFFMVGDDQVADFEAATYASWKAIKLNRDPNRRPEDLASLADLAEQVSGIRT